MKTGACIITYNPDSDTLRSVVNSIFAQVNCVMIIDNDSDNVRDISCICSDFSNVILKKLDSNMGTGYATNAAIKFFLKEKYDFVLTCDQDSIFNDDYIDVFFNIVEEKRQDLNNIAAFVPSYFDVTKNRPGEIYVRTKHGSKRAFFKKNESYLEVFHAIASGMLINLSLISEIGLMDERFFIDMVDIEWCMRAGSAGKKVVCCRDLQMIHHLGDKARKFLGKTFTVRNSIRSYYIIRNGIHVLLHARYLSKCYRFISILKKMFLVVIFTCVSDNHLKTLRYSIKGVFDGFSGKLGKLGKFL